MKKCLFILLLLPITLMAQSYPKKIVIQKDTLILITPIQLKKANLIFIQRDYYRNLSINYDSTIRLYERREANWKQMDIEHQRTEKMLKTQVHALNSRQEIEKKHYTLVLKKEKKKKVKNVIVFSLVGVIVGVIIGVH